MLNMFNCAEQCQWTITTTHTQISGYRSILYITLYSIPYSLMHTIHVWCTTLFSTKQRTFYCNVNVKKTNKLHYEQGLHTQWLSVVDQGLLPWNIALGSSFLSNLSFTFPPSFVLCFHYLSPLSAQSPFPATLSTRTITQPKSECDSAYSLSTRSHTQRSHILPPPPFPVF